MSCAHVSRRRSFSLSPVIIVPMPTPLIDMRRRAKSVGVEVIILDHVVKSTNDQQRYCATLSCLQPIIP